MYVCMYVCVCVCVRYNDHRYVDEPSLLYFTLCEVPQNILAEFGTRPTYWAPCEI